MAIDVLSILVYIYNLKDLELLDCLSNLDSKANLSACHFDVWKAEECPPNPIKQNLTRYM